MIELCVRELREHDISFVASVYDENIEGLHGAAISLYEWEKCLLNEPDPDEANFIIVFSGENAAWLKLNCMSNDIIYVSMLVVAKKYQRMGIGSFALKFAECLAVKNRKAAVRVRTTIDNKAAKNCYLRHGFRIIENIRYAVGDGMSRDGYHFEKEII